MRIEADLGAKDVRKDRESVVQQVMEKCSGLERAVHRPLKAIDEDSADLQTNLHAEAVQTAMATVTAARAQAEMAQPRKVSAESEVRP